MSPDEHPAATGATPVDVTQVRRIERPESVNLAQTENARMCHALAALDRDDWARPTDCTAWDVRALAGHVLGMTETFTGLRRMAATMRAAGRRAGNGPFVDGMTAIQVEQRAHVDTTELLRRMEIAGPRQARWRGRRRLLRSVPTTEEVNGQRETWRTGYLLDVILTRDIWMHRIDLARATGHPHELTPEHDGRIVADVVAEWSRRHGRPFILDLTGAAGGTFVSGHDGQELTLDAVEFCRTLSGRAPGEGLLATEVPF